MRTLALLLVTGLGVAPVVSAQHAGKVVDVSHLVKLADLSKLSKLAHLAELPDESFQLRDGLDPADSIFRLAQRALDRDNYRQAADLFAEVARKYPRSDRAPQALYFQAFALMRLGGTSNLRSARTVLDRLMDRYPDSHPSDASSLRTRVCGELAQRGDAECAAEVTDRATQSDTRRQARCPDPDDENDDRIMALNALLNMDSDRALPVLEGIMNRRGACDYVLRRKAVFLISQKHSGRAADILIKAIREDPDEEVRKQAVFWLAQTRDSRVPGVLRDLVRNASRELQKNAVFALSQWSGGEGYAALRELANSDATPDEIRSDAIFWLGQRSTKENGDFLRELFKRVRSHELKDKIIFSLSQQRGTGSEQWLIDIAMDNSESIEIRKQALFWASQNKSVPFERLATMYDRTTDQEIKESLIFGFSQRNSREAVDKLMSIARSDRDREMRKKAIFWLGQSRDPRVLDFLAELIGK